MTVMTETGLPIMDRNSHLFVGPWKKERGHACFTCFTSYLTSNGSNLASILDQELRGPGERDCGNDLHGLDVHSFINRVLVIDKRSWSVTWKKFRKNPFCPECGVEWEEERKTELHLTDEPHFRVKSGKEISQLLKRYEDELIDADTGVGRALFRDAESNIIPMYAIEAVIHDRTFYSYGRTTGIAESRNAAILELLERYSSMVPRFKAPIVASYEELVANNKKVVPPGRYILRSPLDPDRKLHWTSCREVGTGEAFLIPEQMMYFDNQLLRGETRFLYETSNGTALGGSVEEALVYAILEAVERDCFLVHWYTKRLPRIIDQESLANPHVKGILRTLDQLGYETYLFDITLETEVPAVWVLLRNTDADGQLHLYNAAGSHFDPEAAIFAALVEAGTSVIVYEEKLRAEKPGLSHLIGSPENVTHMEDHVNYYAFRENSGAFDYLFDRMADLERIRVEEMAPRFPFSFKGIVEKVMEHHPRVYFTDMGNELIDEMGLSVVKVFIPTLQPMTFGKQNERLNMERLEAWSEGEVEVGCEPHPFP
ncbi:YcaO-like family protein [Rossellomorea marisflavi]|uniref:YcaO-like family protein n=1 Tax=Rossellomorea marisflavi TaxID=189381 RepID=UPI0006FF9D39|nr:YcaO-like family protein [Rossellomorea marisflavi]KQU63085.1 hypothetical protein ASG66_01335 [Bacillus sp. Leaf406]MCM2603145.1 YcaO-like family protein [Rossellomorea marisflavi]UKS65932.1 YcaO-like family protein [Rossellomorea marisflavi]